MKLMMFILLLAAGISAQSIAVSLQNDRNSYVVGDTVTTALTIEIPKGFHLYANPLGPGVGKPLSITVGASDKIKWLDAFAVKPKKYVQDSENWVWQWEEKVELFIRGVVVTKVKGNADMAITLDGLICKESCIPQKKIVVGSVIIGSKGKTLFTPALITARKNATTFPLVRGNKSVK